MGKIDFHSNSEPTLGIELELGLVDAETLALSNSVGPLLERLPVDDAGCFTYWCQAGTDCGRCMIVCPYAHPYNWFHRFIRFGIRNNILFRRLAVEMDDLFYGMKPKPRDL